MLTYYQGHSFNVKFPRDSLPPPHLLLQLRAIFKLEHKVGLEIQRNSDFITMNDYEKQRIVFYFGLRKG